MEYYDKSEYLAHYGILGMKWGVRRYQNSDGSLTNAGRARYGIKERITKGVTNAADAAKKFAKSPVGKAVIVAGALGAAGAVAVTALPAVSKAVSSAGALANVSANVLNAVASAKQQHAQDFVQNMPGKTDWVRAATANASRKANGQLERAIREQVRNGNGGKINWLIMQSQQLSKRELMAYYIDQAMRSAYGSSRNHHGRSFSTRYAQFAAQQARDHMNPVRIDNEASTWVNQFVDSIASDEQQKIAHETFMQEYEAMQAHHEQAQQEIAAQQQAIEAQYAAMNGRSGRS